MHLAQVNIAALKYPLDDPRVADFARNLDLVNGDCRAQRRVHLASAGRERRRDRHPRF